MLRSNAKMTELLNSRQDLKVDNRRVQVLLAKGFVEEQGCYVLKTLFRDQYREYRQQLQDEVGFEAFVNSIHARDFEPPLQLDELLAFAEWAFASFQSKFPNQSLLATLSVSEDDAILKLYVRREGKAFLSDDLEGYRDEAVLEIDQSGMAELLARFQ